MYILYSFVIMSAYLHADVPNFLQWRVIIRQNFSFMEENFCLSTLQKHVTRSKIAILLEKFHEINYSTYQLDTKGHLFTLIPTSKCKQIKENKTSEYCRFMLWTFIHLQIIMSFIIKGIVLSCCYSSLCSS